jgi:hypothetical protein
MCTEVPANIYRLSLHQKQIKFIDMSKTSNRKKSNPRKKLDTAIVVALIALLGTLITAIFASPAINKLIENWGKSDLPLATPSSTPNSQETAAATGSTGNIIQLNQTVTGTLYYDEAGVWIFNEGPATITIVLDVGPYGEALIILKDPDGVDREYVDAQSGSKEHLINYTIPTDGEYSILVRNSLNSQVNYKLTVEGTKGTTP